MTEDNARSLWSIRSDTTYLNHGSFGPSPIAVQQVRQQFTAELEAQPMEFFCQRMETELGSVSQRLGEFIGCKAGNLLLVDNATVGMNVAAGAIPLEAGDNVVLTDHEYGAVRRLWSRKCEQAGAWLVTAELPFPLDTTDNVVSAVMSATNENTRLIVVSHVTSQTAAVLPVEEICAAARKREIPVCIDGPHAVAMREINLRDIGCDFYTASCHKWLCAPFGSGFLYVHPKWQSRLRPVITSWGGSIAGHDRSWKDDFNWLGTRDPAPLLSIPAAIDFLEEQGLDRFRRHGHQLAQYARNQLADNFQAQAVLPDSEQWYGTMITVRLPEPPGWQPATHGRIDDLQQRLRDDHRLEAPVFGWNGHRCLRVSAHLYNSRADIDRLIDAINTSRDW